MAEGYGFAIAKCTQGTNYHDPHYRVFVNQAKRGGLLFAAYHFLEHGDADAQAANLARFISDKSIPVMIDCEPYKRSRPSMADVHGFIAGCVSRGLNPALLYLPGWYWEQSPIHKAPLKGLPALVQSHYHTTRKRYGSALYTGDHDGAWDSMGGVVPTIWQFGDSAVLKAYRGGTDCNAYRGTLDDLKASGLFKNYGDGPKPAPAKPASKPTTTTNTEDDTLSWDHTYADWAPQSNRPGTMKMDQQVQQARGYAEDAYRNSRKALAVAESNAGKIDLLLEALAPKDDAPAEATPEK